MAFDSDTKSWFKIPKLQGVVQQFTGYVDDEGNDIYEGDLIQYKGNIVDTHYLFLLSNKEIISDVIWKCGRFHLNDGNNCNFIDQLKHKLIVGNIFEPLKNLE